MPSIYLTLIKIIEHKNSRDFRDELFQNLFFFFLLIYQSVSSQEMNGSQGITEGSLIMRLFTEAWGGSREATRKGFPVKPEAIILRELRL